MAMQPAPNNKLDRQTTTPFHLKLFYRASSFHSPSEFPTSTPSPLPPHLQIYTWPTCTLRELSHLLVSALPSLLPSPAIGTRLAYRLIYPDTHPSHPQAPGRYLSKELGNVVVGSEEGGGRGILPSEEEGKLVKGGVMAGYLEGEPDKTLQDARFVIGDFVCCAIFKPGEDGGVVGVPRGIGNGRGRGEFSGGRGGYGSGFGRGRWGGGRGGGGMFNGDSGRLGGEGVPAGEWRRGERVPEGAGGYGRGRGRGY